MTLGKASGIFKLTNSNKHVGSYLIKEDIALILGISEDDLNNIEFKENNNFKVINEKSLMKIWYDNRIRNTVVPAKTSFDELLLKKLIQITYPESIILAQQKIGRYSMDLLVELNGIKKYIEFDSPYHFSISRYGLPRRHPFYKKKIIEDKTGIEVINWPYWIQRCESNVRSIFEKDINGYGAIWSSTVHFGDFVFEDSADVIIKMSSRFNAWGKDGACNYYEENSKGRIKPEHPILNKIIKNKEKIDKIIPKGYNDIELWVPKKIRIKKEDG